MKAYILILLFSFARCIQAANSIFDFESAAVPVDFSADLGLVELSQANSISGDQSLKFTATGAGASLVLANTAPGAVKFTQFSCRLSVAKNLNGAVPNWSPSEAQLRILGLPAVLASASTTSASAQIYIYVPAQLSTPAGWIPVSAPLELDANRNLRQWLRLTVRTDNYTSPRQSDLWINGKLVTIKHPPDVSSVTALTLQLDAGKSAYLDDLEYGDVNPLYIDTDRDGMPDVWEYENAASNLSGSDAGANDRDADPDGDGVDNITEYKTGTRSLTSDSDGDDMSDGWELQFGLNPTSAEDGNVDIDLDGFTNHEEWLAQTIPNNSANHSNDRVVYVKAGSRPEEMGTYENPFATISDALNAVSGAWDTGDGISWRIVLLGSGGPFGSAGDSGLTINVPVRIIGVENAVITPGSVSAAGPPWTMASVLSLQGHSVEQAIGEFPSVEIENVSFESWMAGTRGAAISFEHGQLTLRRCRFTNCRAGENGGALFLQDVNLTAEECSFNLNSVATAGGSVWAGNCTSAIRRCRFTSCTSTNGNGTAMAFDGGTALIENCFISNCGVADLSGAAGAGALALSGSCAATVSFSTLLNNVATHGAGGIFNGNTSQAVNLDSCILWNNRVGWDLVQVNSTATWNANYCTLQSQLLAGVGNNSIQPNFISGTPLLRTITSSVNGRPQGPVADIDGTSRTGSGNSGPERGAFEFADADGDGLPTPWELSNLFNPSDKSDGEQDFDQDGYTNLEEYVRNSNPRIAQYPETYTCIYVDPVVGSDSQMGAGPAIGGITAPVQSIAKALTLLNPAPTPYNYYARTRICLRNGTYSGASNRGLSASGYSSGAPAFLIKSLNGPASVVIDAENQNRFFKCNVNGYYTHQWTIRGLTFRRCKAPGIENGGAVLVSNYSHSLTIENCSFIGCTAANGGAVSYEPSSTNVSRFLTVTNSIFQGCEATGNGGAINGNNYAEIRVDGVSFSYNAATLQGGAVYRSSAAGLIFKNSVFHRNSAPTGGAACIKNAMVWSNVSSMGGSNFDNYFTNCIFTENLAASTSEGTTNEGGALALIDCTCDLHGCRFVGNLSASIVDGWARGGAVYIRGGAPSVFGCDFSGNQCGELGGAVFVSGYGNGTALTGNPPATSAPTSGGAITRFANCALRGNSASFGGAVYVGGEPANTQRDAAIVHCTFTGNTASQTGAALLAAGDVAYHKNLTWSNFPTNVQIVSQTGGPDTLTASGNNSEQDIPADLSDTSVSRPYFAFDGIHIAIPLTGPSGAGTEYALELYPGTSNYQYYDYDREFRPSDSQLSAPGCDQSVDSEPDGLPDWFEDYIINYSELDGITTRSQLNGVTQLNGSRFSLAVLLTYGGDPTRADGAQSTADYDHDGIIDLDEAMIGTSLTVGDTDGDGMSDLDEWKAGYKPNDSRSHANELISMDLWTAKITRHVRRESINTAFAGLKTYFADQAILPYDIVSNPGAQDASAKNIRDESLAELERFDQNPTPITRSTGPVRGVELTGYYNWTVAGAGVGAASFPKSESSSWTTGQLRITRPVASKAAVSKSFLLVYHECTEENGPSIIDKVHRVTLNILPDKTESAGYLKVDPLYEAVNPAPPSESRSIEDPKTAPGSDSIGKTWRVYVVPLDFDTDSDNTNGTELPENSPREEQEENFGYTGANAPAHPGKIVMVNDGDADRDGIPDFADNQNTSIHDLATGLMQVQSDFTQSLPQGLDKLSRLTSKKGGSFVPVQIKLGKGLPSNSQFKFDYKSAGFNVIKQVAGSPGTVDGYTLAAPAPQPGALRVWRKSFADWRRKEPINEDGDYIKPGLVYTAQQLGLPPESSIPYNGTALTLYVEALSRSQNVADTPITLIVLNPVFPEGRVELKLKFTAIGSGLCGVNLEGNTFRTNQMAVSPQAPLISNDSGSQSPFVLSSIHEDQNAYDYRLVGNLTQNLQILDEHLNTFPSAKIPAHYREMIVNATLNGVSINSKLSSESNLHVEWQELPEHRSNLRSPFPRVGKASLNYTNVPLVYGTNVLRYEVAGFNGLSGSMTGVFTVEESETVTGQFSISTPSWKSSGSRFIPYVWCFDGPATMLQDTKFRLSSLDGKLVGLPGTPSQNSGPRTMFIPFFETDQPALFVQRPVIPVNEFREASDAERSLWEKRAQSVWGGISGLMDSLPEGFLPDWVQEGGEPAWMFFNGILSGLCDGGGGLLWGAVELGWNMMEFVGQGTAALASQVPLIGGVIEGTYQYVWDEKPSDAVKRKWEHTKSGFMGAWDIASKIGKIYWKLGQDFGAAVTAGILDEDVLLEELGDEYAHYMDVASLVLDDLWNEVENMRHFEKGYITGKVMFELASMVVGAGAAAKVIDKVKILRIARDRFSKAKMDAFKKLVAILDKWITRLTSIEFRRYCFVAGTLVHTARGPVPIEQIAVGDRVLARDESDPASQCFKRVEGTMITHPRVLQRITYQLRGAGGVHTETIATTSGHPFYVLGRTSVGFVAADSLTVGDILSLGDYRTATVTGNVAEISGEGETFVTYNISVEDYHTYFVGESGVWAHNFSLRFCQNLFDRMERARKKLNIPEDAISGRRMEIFDEGAKGTKLPANVGSRGLHIAGRDEIADYATANPVSGSCPDSLSYSNQERIRRKFGAHNYEIHHLSEQRFSNALGISRDKWDSSPAINLPEGPPSYGGGKGFSTQDAADYSSDFQEMPVYHKGDNGLVERIGAIFEKVGLPKNSNTYSASFDQKQDLINRLQNLYKNEPDIKHLKLWPVTRDWLRASLPTNSGLIVPD